MDTASIINQIANQYGIPPYIPLTIAKAESGLNPNAIGDNGTSFGLFQLHRGGLAPANMTDSQLLNPVTNAQIAIQRMVPAYRTYASQGLTGMDLVKAVANTSGWPGNLGVAWTSANTNYNQKLAAAYQEIAGGSTGVPGLTPVVWWNPWTWGQDIQDWYQGSVLNPSNWLPHAPGLTFSQTLTRDVIYVVLGIVIVVVLFQLLPAVTDGTIDPAEWGKKTAKMAADAAMTAAAVAK